MYPILSTSHVDGIRAQHGASIALFLACYTCAFDHRLDCLGEELLRSEGAPVAVIGGTRMTMPYAMTTLSSGMLQECLTGRRKTVGEVLMHAKRRMMRDAGDDPVRKMLDSIARTLTPGDTDPADERAEHLHLMNLLGDPMLRIRYPGPVEVQVTPRAIAGESIEITGRASVEGTAAIELVVRRDRLTFEPEPRGVFPAGDDALAAFQAVYNKANDPRLATIDVQVRDGEFAGKLTVPQDVQGRVHVRVLVTGNQGSAAGAADVYVRRATKAR
jgi:hypothetical protein